MIILIIKWIVNCFFQLYIEFMLTFTYTPTPHTLYLPIHRQWAVVEATEKTGVGKIAYTNIKQSYIAINLFITLLLVDNLFASIPLIFRFFLHHEDVERVKQQQSVPFQRENPRFTVILRAGFVYVDCLCFLGQLPMYIVLTIKYLRLSQMSTTCSTVVVLLLHSNKARTLQLWSKQKKRYKDN